MLLKILVPLLFVCSGANAKTLSEAVFNENNQKKDNYFFSNTSVDGLLSLISFGLTSTDQEKLIKYWGGISITEKSKLLSSLNQKTPGVTISTNYQIWLDHNYFFMPEYLSEVSKNFGVVPEQVNFQDKAGVVSRVNSWSAKNTNNLIKNIIDQDFLTPDMMTILANATYFKGEWESQFDKNLTKLKEFKSVGLVETMIQEEDVMFSYNQYDKALVVELPFKGNRQSMILVMPAQISKYDEYDNEYPAEIAYREENIKNLFKNYILNSKALKELEENGYAGGALELPKFTIESSVENIESKLEKLGLSSLFQSGALFKMINHPSVQLSKVLQKAKIIVNEEGAEAAAVTVGGIVAVSEPAPPITLKFNGPFSYMILDKRNNERLFEGIVFNPKK